MKRWILLTACAALFLAAPLAASADQTTDLLGQAARKWQSGDAKAALGLADLAGQAIWQKVPLYVQKAVLTGAKAASYGMYQVRPNNVYSAAKDAILLYVEPVGYRIDRGAQGLYQFGFSADLAFLDAEGNILFGKENFMSVDFASHVFNREIFLNISVNISGVKPGKYILAILVKDTGGQKVPLRVPVEFR